MGTEDIATEAFSAGSRRKNIFALLSAWGEDRKQFCVVNLVLVYQLEIYGGKEGKSRHL